MVYTQICQGFTKEPKITHVVKKPMSLTPMARVSILSANTKRWPDGVLMLARRLRRRSSIKTPLGQRVVFCGTIHGNPLIRYIEIQVTGVEGTPLVKT